MRQKLTEEPGPEEEMKSTQDFLVYVVQKHQASRLHYDFQKRLAIMVEDHPLEYRTFEGVIAEGEYGAGEVIVWDQGTYSPLAGKTKDAMQEQVRKQLNQGALRFLLFGEKLRGDFALIRQKWLGEKAWLLIKKRDHYASDADVTLQDRSVITGKRLGEAK